MFTADIQEVEQERLQEIAKTRTLLRDDMETIHQQQTDTSQQDIQIITTDPDMTNSSAGGGHDYINQAMVDMVLQDSEGKCGVV